MYSRDYVIDYTSLERDDLMVFAEGDGQLDYVQREVYAGSERIEQFTDRSSGGYERLLYVHEDLMGNTRYYTKANGQSYAELTYDAWGMPESPNKLLNNDHGNYVYATYTGHIFDTTLDIYFAEARFYDANTRTWLAMDPIKDGDNWYQYCNSSPVTYMDPDGAMAVNTLNFISDMYNAGWLDAEYMTALVLTFNANNIPLGFHEIAQIETAAQLHAMGLQTELEYKTSVGEVDVVAKVFGEAVYAWEIKPYYTSGAEQLQKYIDASDLHIRNTPLADVYDIPIVGDIKMGITYSKSPGVGNYYFYKVNNCASEYSVVEVKDEIEDRVVKASVAAGAIIGTSVALNFVTGGISTLDDVPSLGLAAKVAYAIIR